MKLTTYLEQNELEKIVKNIKIMELESSEDIEWYEDEIAEKPDGEYLCNLSFGNVIIKHSQHFNLL